MSKGNLAPTEPAIITWRAVIVGWLVNVVVVHRAYKKDK